MFWGLEKYLAFFMLKYNLNLLFTQITNDV